MTNHLVIEYYGWPESDRILQRGFATPPHQVCIDDHGALTVYDNTTGDVIEIFAQGAWRRVRRQATGVDE